VFAIARSAAGGRAAINVNIRVVASTNRDLEAEVCKENFRSDLFRRLTRTSICLAALANRRDDISDLAMHFIKNVSQANHRAVFMTNDAFTRNGAYSWPGNVREFKNLVGQIVLLPRKPLLEADDHEAFMPSRGRPVSGGKLTEKFTNEMLRGRSFIKPREHRKEEVGRVAKVWPERPYPTVGSHEAKALMDALQQCSGNRA